MWGSFIETLYLYSYVCLMVTPVPSCPQMPQVSFCAYLAGFTPKILNWLEK